MKLTPDLKKEFIASLQRLAESINVVIASDYYDYNQLSEIHRTYIEYCKAFVQIDEFSEITLNTEIKFPKLLFKSNWAGNPTLKEYLLFGKYTQRNYWFEGKCKIMLNEISENLELIGFCLRNENLSDGNEVLKILQEKIINQLNTKRKKKFFFF